MKRGAGRMLQAALNSHKYANGGMVTPGSTPISNQMPVQHFDRGGEVSGGVNNSRLTNTGNNSSGGMFTGSRLTSNDPNNPTGYKSTYVNPQWQGWQNKYMTDLKARDPQGYAMVQEYQRLWAMKPGSNTITFGEHGEQTGGGPADGGAWSKQYGPQVDALRSQLDARGLISHPSGGGFFDKAMDHVSQFMDHTVPLAVQVATMAGIGYGVAGAGAGMMGSTGAADTAGGFSQVPAGPTFGQTASGATMSTVPSGYASGAGYMGGAAGAGSAAGAYDPYSSSSWQAQNSSQVPGTTGGFDPGAINPEINMSVVPGGSAGFDPYGVGGGMGGGSGGFSAEGGTGFSGPNGYGTNASSVNPDYTGGGKSSLDMPASGSSNAYTNAGFNSDASMPYGDSGDVSGGLGQDIARNPYDTQLGQPTIQATPDSIGQRVMNGALGKWKGLPEAVGAALPGMAVGLGAKLIAGNGSVQNDPGYAPAVAQTANDQARNDIALKSQQEFANNASKYGTDDYYRQMGDMSAMQFRSGRVQQRQLLQQQLQAQGRDPATVNALLQNFDNSTETGSVNSRNSAYLASRNSGLGAQQQAAGMFAPGSGATALSNIANNADQRTRRQIGDITNIFGAPFTQQQQTQGQQSGQVATNAADSAAKAVSDKTTFGLDSSVYSRK